MMKLLYNCRDDMRKLIVSLMIIGLVFSGQVIQIKQAEGGLNDLLMLSGLPPSRISIFRQIIGSNDEGSHYKENSTHQEWWYYIAFFNHEDSELKNWSMMVSFNQMGVLDVLFCTVFDDNNNSYGGLEAELKGVMKADGPNVNVEFNGSTVVGSYPNYEINAKRKKANGEIVFVNVTYKANAKPMWLFANSGLNRSNSNIGHYCIIESEVSGTVSINGTSYYVRGVGYHEHSWINDGGKDKRTRSLFSKTIFNKELNSIPDWQFDLNAWDWGAMFFDNGWNIFSAKICQQSLISKILPGSLWVTNDKGKHVTECRYFQFKYVETQNTSIPNLTIPSKIQVKGVFFSAFLRHPFRGLVRLNLEIELTNLREFSWCGDDLSIGVWEIPCKVHGNIRWFGHYEELNGVAMLELTRAVKHDEK